MNGRVASGVLSLCFLLPCAVSAAEADKARDGVYADVPFLGADSDYPVNPTHIVIDLAPRKRRPMPLMLDTGAGFSVMTPGAAKALGVSVRRLKQDPYRRKTVLGRDLQFYIDTISSDTGSRSGWEIGVLGGNFLEHYSVEIDYAAQRVRFLDPRKHPVPAQPSRPGEIIAPLRIDGRRPYVQLAVGSGTASFLVDTGAYFDLEVSQRTAKRLGLAVDESEIAEGHNWIGRDRSARSQLESVRMAEHELGPSSLLTTLREGSSWRHTNQAGKDEAVLGGAFLNRFHVRIDYRHRRMSLMPLTDDERKTVLANLAAGKARPGSAARRARPQGKGTSQLQRAGVQITRLRQGHYRVDKADAGGAADRLGLREGDMIFPPLGAKPLTPKAIEARIVAGQDLTVARKQSGSWIETNLPERVYSDE